MPREQYINQTFDVKCVIQQLVHWIYKKKERKVSKYFKISFVILDRMGENVCGAQFTLTFFKKVPGHILTEQKISHNQYKLKALETL